MKKILAVLNTNYNSRIKLCETRSIQSTNLHWDLSFLVTSLRPNSRSPSESINCFLAMAPLLQTSKIHYSK